MALQFAQIQFADWLSYPNFWKKFAARNWFRSLSCSSEVRKGSCQFVQGEMDKNEFNEHLQKRTTTADHAGLYQGALHKHNDHQINTAYDAHMTSGHLSGKGSHSRPRSAKPEAKVYLYYARLRWTINESWWLLVDYLQQCCWPLLTMLRHEHQHYS